MRLDISLNLDGAAFEDVDGRSLEVARILERWARDLVQTSGVLAPDGHVETLRDINGNACGWARVVED